MKTKATTTSAAMLMGMCLMGSAARATTFNVRAKNSPCSLKNAVNAVNHRGKAISGCGTADGDSDTINLERGGTYPVTELVISSPVIIQSWDFGTHAGSRTLATILQAGKPTNFDTAMIQINNGDPALASSTLWFRDIDFKGTGTTNPAAGIAAHGNDTGDTLIISRCWIEQFGYEGISDQSVSLLMTDSAVDGNGLAASSALFGASGITLESTGPTAFTHLTLKNVSVTNNIGGGVFLELGAGSTSGIVNSTIASNHGGPGIRTGGTHSHFSLLIAGSTVFHNTADLIGQNCQGDPSNAGGVLNVNEDDATIALSQSVVSGNLGVCGTSLDFVGVLASMTNSLLEDIFNCINIFIPLAPGDADHNYPIPQTTFIGTNVFHTPSGLDTHLTDNGGVSGARHPFSNKPLPGSAAVDVAASADPILSGMDQGHRPRGVGGTSGARFDLGAVELQ
jgi:hypothetical protein